jgi:hypothetical protein
MGHGGEPGGGGVDVAHCGVELSKGAHRCFQWCASVAWVVALGWVDGRTPGGYVQPHLYFPNLHSSKLGRGATHSPMFVLFSS